MEERVWTFAERKEEKRGAQPGPGGPAAPESESAGARWEWWEGERERGKFL